MTEGPIQCAKKLMYHHQKKTKRKEPKKKMTTDRSAAKDWDHQIFLNRYRDWLCCQGSRRRWLSDAVHRFGLNRVVGWLNDESHLNRNYPTPLRANLTDIDYLFAKFGRDANW